MAGRHRTSAASAAVRPLITIERARPDWWPGLRAGVAFAVPVILGLALHQTFAGAVAGFAALNVALTDTGGPLWRRILSTAAATLLCALVLTIGIGFGSGPVVAVVLVGVVFLGGGLMVPFGKTGLMFGMAIPVLAAISLGLPHGLHNGLVALVAALIGGAFSMALTLAVWPLLRRRPERESLAHADRATAELAERLADRVGARGSEESAAAASSARLEFSAAMRSALVDTSFVLGHGDLRPHAARAEEIGLACLVLAERADALGDGAGAPAARRSASAALERVARQMRARADAMLSRHPGEPDDRAWREDVRGIAAALSSEPGVHSVGRAIRDLAAADVQASPEGRLAGRRYALGPIGTLRAVLARDSRVLRHALRESITGMAAVLVFLLVGVPDGYWIVLSVAVLSKPTIQATLARVEQRIVGTVIGALVGGALVIALADHPYVSVLLGGALVFAMVALIPLSYTFWVLALTPFVLLTVGLLDPGDWRVALWRVVSTLIGAVLVIATAFLLWPSPPGSAAVYLLARDLRAHGDLARALADGASGGEWLRLARAATGAEIEVRAEIEGWETRPGGSTEIMRHRRIVRRVRGVRDRVLDLAEAADDDPEAFGRAERMRVRSAAAVLGDLAAGLGGRRPVGPPPPAESRVSGGVAGEVDRLCRAVAEVHQAVAQQSAPAGPDATAAAVGPAS